MSQPADRVKFWVSWLLCAAIVVGVSGMLDIPGATDHPLARANISPTAGEITLSTANIADDLVKHHGVRNFCADYPSECENSPPAEVWTTRA